MKKKKTTTHPLRIYLEMQSVSVRAFARYIDLSRQQLINIINGTCEPKQSTLERISDNTSIMIYHKNGKTIYNLPDRKLNLTKKYKLIGTERKKPVDYEYFLVDKLKKLK